MLTGTDLPLGGQRLDGLALQVIFGAVLSPLDLPPDGSPLPDPLGVGKSPYATTVFENVGTKTLPSAITGWPNLEKSPKASRVAFCLLFQSSVETFSASKAWTKPDGGAPVAP